jgi:hypothetical protein
VFNNPDASDPSHSLLSKDHFGYVYTSLRSHACTNGHPRLILNEPAGKIALVVVKHSVELIVQAWYKHDTDVGQTINQVRHTHHLCDTKLTQCDKQIMEAFHHPYYATGNSQIQNEMAEELSRWFGGLGSEVR